METKISIRRARKEDLDDILRLTASLCENERQNFGSDWNTDWVNGRGREIAAQDIAADDGFVLVAQYSGRIVAFLRASLYWEGWMEWKNGKGAELWDFYIEKEFRSRSIGRQMMAKFLDWCREMKADYVLVNVTVANRRAKKFYEKFGFADAQIVMEKKIIQNHGKKSRN